MNFSIILNSRQRSQLLVGLLNSIQNNTADVDNVEVLICIDNDDAESQDARIHLTARHSFVKFFNRERTHMLNGNLNWLYEIAGTGRFVIACNDDCIFQTKHWDQVILDKLNAYLADKPDGIVYGYISDALIDRHGAQYCCFPLVSRSGVLALGFVMPPQFPAWSADVAIWQIYRDVGRVCDISEVMIEHIAYHSGKRGRDEVSYHVERISLGNSAGHVPYDEYKERLRRAMSQI